ncbi:MAG: hypothetical protein KVP17_000829 [Porospora cf. gigantea B]|uniref:uncharacterized protein n=1 Tax=Porospora cf. gigantea B TaxID=2853592 RepID=UPI0035719FCD|nr:MAG: hypothetical protein KVP17_000829 [Porospora cf. gigantea B]
MIRDTTELLSQAPARVSKARRNSAVTSMQGLPEEAHQAFFDELVSSLSLVDNGSTPRSQPSQPHTQVPSILSLRQAEFVPADELDRDPPPLSARRATKRASLLRKLKSFRALRFDNVVDKSRFSLFTPRLPPAPTLASVPSLRSHEAVCPDPETPKSPDSRTGDAGLRSRRRRKNIPRPPDFSVCALCGRSYASHHDNKTDTKPEVSESSTPSAAMAKRATHFVALRLHQPYLTSNIERMQDQIVEESPHLQPAVVNSTKMHISLLVLSLKPRELSVAIATLRAAVSHFCQARKRDLLERCELTCDEEEELASLLRAKNLVEHIPERLSNEDRLALETQLLPVDITMNHLGTFGPHVLFASPPPQEVALLTNFHEVLSICFSKTGLMVIGAGSHLNGAFDRPTSHFNSVPCHSESLDQVNMAALASTAYYLPVKASDVPGLRLCERCQVQREAEGPAPRTTEKSTSQDFMQDFAKQLQTPRLAANAAPDKETGKQRRRRKRRQKLRKLEKENQRLLLAAASQDDGPLVHPDTDRPSRDEVDAFQSARNAWTAISGSEMGLLTRYDAAAKGVVFHPHATVLKTSVAMRKAKGSTSKVTMRQLRLRPKDFHTAAVRESIRSSAIDESTAEVLTNYQVLDSDGRGEWPTASDVPLSTPLLRQTGEGLAVGFGQERVLCVELLEMSRCDFDGYYKRLCSIPLCCNPPVDESVQARLEWICSSREHATC